ncbi:MAG: ABC transporter substrate-binding protein [Candidatus Caldarchaeum sp.]
MEKSVSALSKAVAIIIVVVVAAAAVGISTILLTRPFTAEPIKIGVLTPLSPPADYISGKLILTVAEIFKDYTNERGGVLGRRIELVVEDQTLDPAKAVASLQRMVTQDKIVGLIGPWESLVALPVARATKDFPTIMFVTYSWADEITADKPKYVFRVGIFNSLFATHLLDYIKFKRYTNVAILAEQSPYGLGFRDSMVQIAKQNIPDLKISSVEAPQEKVDFTAELLKIKELKPQLLIVAMNLPAAAIVQKQFHELGLNEVMESIPGNDWPTWDGGKTWWETLGSKGVGGLYPTYYSPHMKVTPVGEEFRKLYKARTGFEPVHWIYWYWDSLRILKEAVEKTGSTDPDTLAKYIENIDMEGSTGRIKFINDPTPGSPLWHQWTGMTQYIMRWTEVGQPPEKTRQIFPPIE